MTERLTDDISPNDLDLIGHNSAQTNGDTVADLIENVTGIPGPDDGDGLGTNDINQFIDDLV